MKISAVPDTLPRVTLPVEAARTWRRNPALSGERNAILRRARKKVLIHKPGAAWAELFAPDGECLTLFNVNYEE